MREEAICASQDLKSVMNERGLCAELPALSREKDRMIG